jgi:hypothetical protein
MPLLRSILVALLLSTLALPAQAGKLTLDVGKAEGVTMVGAFRRYDEDGNFRIKPEDFNKDAKIDVPRVDFQAKHTGGGKWVFDNLPPDQYDLVIMANGKTRIEGFNYPPVLEFDPFFPGDKKANPDHVEWIEKDIRVAPQYENKVVPLYLGGDDKQIRILMMLIRDKANTYIAGSATIRFEIWQYDWQYGGWAKSKRTRVLHRVLLQGSDLRQWTWLWDAKLGGIEVKNNPKTIHYQMPEKGNNELKGLTPY